MKLIPSFPYCDLDGRPHPHCDHQTQTNDEAELAVIRGIGDTIIRAGIPELPAPAGVIVETTWGCERNTKLTTRQAFIYRVDVGLVRHPRSMCYRPALRYYGCPVDKHNAPDLLAPGKMVLTQFIYRGNEWTISAGEFLPGYSFWLESVSPYTGNVQRLDGTGVHIIHDATTTTEDAQ